MTIRIIRWSTCAAALVVSAQACLAGFVMVPNISTGRQAIALFNSSDGSLVDPSFIVGDGNNVFTSPREAIQVGHQVWISDQVANKVFRYDLDAHAFLPAITGDGTTSLSNLRGIELVGNTVYVANAGSGFGNSIVTINATSGQVTGSFAVTTNQGPWDVQAYNGNLLISNYSSSASGQSHVDVYSTAGSFLNTFVTTTNNQGGLFGPQQVTVESNGNVLVGGFSGAANSGVYEFNSAGTQLGRVASALGPRGGYRLDNGNIMFTKGDGVWAWDIASNSAVGLYTGTGVVNATYISPITYIPAPGTAVMGLLLCLGARRRAR
ncbi:MAG: hypothetical protein WC718_03660 [Phycisphaerales bacterium]|jgi:hypothetical protein